LRLGPKNVLASFGELHPRALKALGIEGRVVAFEIAPDNLPAPRKKSASKAKKALTLSDLMPVHRDFAFIVDEAVIEAVSAKIVEKVMKAGGRLRG